jgi:outer membrane receptor protein involved in Fe transport
MAGEVNVRTKHIHGVMSLAAVLAVVAVLPGPVLAQGTEEIVLDEIVVTAQKREESLSDVPLSVEAVSGAKLLEAGIMRLDDLKAYVPNLQMTETGIANNIYIRGIGSGLNQGFEQSVSTYADGIYRGRGHQSRMPFLDLARVEVLRGPQPILFGKNAVAGAVNLVSARPGDKFEGYVRGWYDTELKETVGDLVLSGPISDTFGARLALRDREADGYVNNLTMDRNEPHRTEFSGRVTLDWHPSETLDSTLRIEGGDFSTRGRQIEIFGETPSGNPAFSGLTYSQIVSGGALPLIGRPTGLPQGTSPSASNNVIDYQRSSQGDTSKLNTREMALTVNYNFANSLTLTSVTGYSKYDLDELCDCDFVGATVFNAGVTENYTQFSQELRLTSPADQRLSWIGGLFYQRYNLDETDYLYLPPTSLAIPVLALNPALGPTAAIRAANAAVFANAANPRVYAQDSKLSSAFFQGTIKIADQFNVVLGGRYSKEDKTGSRVTTLTSGLGGPLLPAATYPLFAGVLGIIPHNVAGSLSESNFSPLVNLQWKFNGDSMLYLSGSRGYKSGGFDARSNKPPVAGGNPTNSGTFQFAPEEATTYELGLKSRIADRAEVNVAVFSTDYKDLQTSAFDGVIGFNVGNGTAKVKGVELEGRWQATQHLRVTGSLASLDFEWTSYFGQCAFGTTAIASGPNAGNCDHTGDTNQLAPKTTGTVGAEYTWNLGGNSTLKAGVDVNYSDSYLLSLNLDQNATQSSFTKLNARVQWAGLDNRLTLAVVGRNLTDKTTLSYAGDTPLSARLFTARSYYGFVDPPRAVALEAGYRF